MLALSVLLVLPLGAGAPEVGRKKWCASLQAKPKGHWSVNETAAYAKHCIFKWLRQRG